MSLKKLNDALQLELNSLYKTGSAKGKEMVITGVKPAEGNKGPRYYVEGEGNKEFLKMNANSYLGMSLRKDVIEAEEKAAREFGVGPGAVRFISGTYKAHTVQSRSGHDIQLGLCDKFERSVSAYNKGYRANKR